MQSSKSRGKSGHEQFVLICSGQNSAKTQSFIMKDESTFSRIKETPVQVKDVDY